MRHPVDPTLEFGPRPPRALQPPRRRRAGLLGRATLVLGLIGVSLAGTGLGLLMSGGRSARRAIAHGAVSCPRPTRTGSPVAGETVLRADLLGVGCSQLLVWQAPVLLVHMPTGGVRSYRFGGPGDQVLVGRFECSARPRIASYRPSSGEVRLYPPLTAGLAGGRRMSPRVESTGLPNSRAFVVAARPGCDEVAVAAVG